jgi:DNA repair protein RadC
MSNTSSGLFVLGSDGHFTPAPDDTVIAAARQVLDARFVRGGRISGPSIAKDYFIVQLSPLSYEVFSAMFLDVANGILAVREMFRGTLTQTAVYPREIVIEALRLNAASVIFAHNHPSSGSAEPSRADEVLTDYLKAALALVDVRVLDHLVVSGGKVTSFAETGRL